MLRLVSNVRRSMVAPLNSADGIGPGIQEAAKLYAVEMQKRFNRASGGDGTWKPLAPSTVKKKARETLFPRQILYLTGAMFASLTPGAPNNVYDVLRDRVRYGTKDKKAGYHQKGGGRLPQRRILIPPSQELIQQCTAPIVAQWQKVITRHVAASRIAA